MKTKTKTKTKEERGKTSQNSTPDGALVRPSSAQIQQRGANLMAQAPSPQQDAWLQATAAVARGSTRDRELVQVPDPLRDWCSQAARWQQAMQQHQMICPSQSCAPWVTRGSFSTIEAPGCNPSPPSRSSSSTYVRVFAVDGNEEHIKTREQGSCWEPHVRGQRRPTH